MIELPLILMAGLLGSSHCVGMCGGFALTIGSTANAWQLNLRRQLLFTLGRLFTYTSFGAAAGFVGWRMQDSIPSIVNIPATFAIVAGLFLVYQGLAALGALPWTRRTGRASTCLGGTFLATFLTSPGWTNVFLAGLFTGFLPCGLLYGMLALAASSQSVLLGGAAMLVFGIGTAPIMMLTGFSGSVLGLATRRRLLRLAACCVVLTGLISVARGLGYVSLPGYSPAGCPICHPTQR